MLPGLGAYVTEADDSTQSQDDSAKQEESVLPSTDIEGSAREDPVAEKDLSAPEASAGGGSPLLTRSHERGLVLLKKPLGTMM